MINSKFYFQIWMASALVSGLKFCHSLTPFIQPFVEALNYGVNEVKQLVTQSARHLVRHVNAMLSLDFKGFMATVGQWYQGGMNVTHDGEI